MAIANNTQKNYFLSHSVGLPFAGMETHFAENYFAHWHQENEPWPKWIEGIDNFRQQIANLINADINDLCPQSNLSSGLTKFIYSLPSPASNKNVILCSAEDFPSMAFVLQKAQSLGYQLQFIPENTNLQILDNWQQHLSANTAICLVTHVQSNNGQQLPVKDIVALCRAKDIISIVDVAQSIGLLEVDSQLWNADLILGSCVKWLCGGPGASFLWINPLIINKCEPVDVGWFSHANPFEFNPYHFDYANTALKFWGGTPSVAAYIHASFAVSKVNEIGVAKMRDINYCLLQQIHNTVSEVNASYIQSPINKSECSGTAILHFGQQQANLVKHLTTANIAFDQRQQGVRLSPHYYTTQQEMDNLLACIKAMA